jgi:hypothetical protein
MAITASGLYLATLVDVLDTTQLAVDLDLETHKGALFSNTLTHNYGTDTAYGVAPYNANEVTGTNWATGGVALTGTTFLVVSNTAVFDATDVSVGSVTFTGARLYHLYADALAGNNSIFGINLVSDQSPSAGTFTITWSASGIVRFVNP